MKATSTLAQIRPLVGVKMRKATAPPPPNNGNGSLSAEDSDSLSGESLEGSMELSVILPDGQVVQTSVERRTPMMDLLVQVTKTNGLSPGSFVLDVQRERSRNSTLYKPNTPVGSLHTSILYVVPKSSVRDIPVRKDSKTGAQPFEKTFRLRVHLPRNQLHVLRVSQNTPLIDIFNVICAERELNSARYELRHPVHVEERLDPQRCLADYCLSEVAIVSVKEPSSAFSHSASDIMALQQDDDRKKNRFFGFMFKKSKSISKSIGDTSSEGHSSRGVSPARSDGSGSQSISPPPSTVGHSRLNGASNNSSSNNNNNNNNNNIINNKLSKKRPAPPPPKSALPQSVPPPLLEGHRNGDAQTSGSHSRHSSDSSGYHEASILSESPEATMHDLVPPSEYKATALAAKKTPILTNLTTVNSNSSLSVLSGPKKRKAPAPPPNPVGNAGSEIGSLSTPTSPTPGPATDSDMASTDENCSFNVESVVTKGGQLNNDKSAQRSDSTSSHASSSSSEELKVVAPKVSTKLSTAPVPLPRQSKTPPVLCRTVVQEEVAVMEKMSETLISVDVGHDLNETITNVSDERLNFKDADSDSQNGQSKAAHHETNSSISGSVTQLNAENEKLSSNSSLDSVHSNPNQTVVDNNCMDKHDAAVSQVVSLESNSKQCNWTSTKESYEAEVIATLRKMSVESQSSSDSSDNTEIAVVVASGDSEEHVVDRHASKKDSVACEEYSDAKKIDKRLSVSSDQIESTLTKAATSSLKSSTRSEIDMDVPEAVNMELCAELVMQVSSEPETDEAVAHSDLFSFRECKDSGDMEEDLKTLPKNDESVANRFDDKNFRKSSTSSSESVNISSKPSKMQQEPHVKESDVITLNARIDQTISEHKIAAEIDEAFASIDLMDNESENGYDSSNSAVTSSDPVITWEYKIPVVPRQFQNDYEGTEQGSTKSSLHSTDSNKDQNPLKYSVDDSEKKETEVKHYPKENSLIANASAENIATEKVDVQVRRVYRKPVVNFSISTYKTRDEEEVRYGHKLTKVDSFSQRPNLIGEPSVPQDSKIDFVASSFTTLSKPKADHLVPRQSSAIPKVIATTNDSSPTPIIDKSEARESRPEGGMRKAKSELQLNDQTGSNLSLSNGFVTEQERLQQEYLKLHEQFLQWQQQLLQNQTILQQQQILPESSTETLQRIQQLQQQIMSLPLQSTLPASQQQPTPVTDTDTKDYSQKTRSLPRPKPAATTNSSTSNGNSNSLERRLPRVGPRPWRPVAVSVSSWNKQPAETVQDEINKQSERPVQIITADKRQVSNGPSVSTEAAVTKEVQKTIYPAAKTPLNAFNSEKSVNIVNKQPTQAPAFRRCPVVKGFAMDPQPKSRVIITSAKENPVTNELNSSSNVSQINGVHSKPGVLHVNISPKVTNLNLEKSKMFSYSKETHANTLPSKTSKTERVYFGGAPTKPSVQTYTYFGAKVGTTTNKIAVSRDTESTAVQKIANNVSLTKPKSYNFGSAMYNTDMTEKSADKKFTTVVSLTPKQKTLQSIPPPPPPEPIIVSQGTSVIKPANVQTKKSPTSPTANGDFKDELMDAIRSFGGRSGLKKVSSSETQWENRHGKFN